MMLFLSLPLIVLALFVQLGSLSPSPPFPPPLQSPPTTDALEEASIVLIVFRVEFEDSRRLPLPPPGAIKDAVLKVVARLGRPLRSNVVQVRLSTNAIAEIAIPVDRHRALPPPGGDAGNGPHRNEGPQVDQTETTNDANATSSYNVSQRVAKMIEFIASSNFITSLSRALPLNVRLVSEPQLQVVSRWAPSMPPWPRRPPDGTPIGEQGKRGREERRGRLPARESGDDIEDAIIGGAIGGAAGIILLGAAALFCVQKTRKPPRAFLASAVPVEMVPPSTSTLHHGGVSAPDGVV